MYRRRERLRIEATMGGASIFTVTDATEMAAGVGGRARPRRRTKYDYPLAR